MSTLQERLGQVLTEELLDLLDEAYPHRAPNPNDSEREIWMKAGERRLVDTLRSHYRAAQEDDNFLES